MSTSISLHQLGWSPFFQQQLSLEEWEAHRPGRVVGQHRSNIDVMTEQGRKRIALPPGTIDFTVGDWLLLAADDRFQRLLDRLSSFSRRAAGTKAVEQLIAANIDTAFIVSSLNDDFNLSRMERYLALARDAGVEPVVVLTKADQCTDPAFYVRQARALDPSLMVESVNALDPDSVEVLRSWCREGQTVTVLGSSGVGKSTLINTLLGRTAQATAAIREDDSKGRHTTTSRSLHFIPDGGLLLDTPGMRELQLADCEQGVSDVFADIEDLTADCRFSDCRHEGEPGCAVRAALESGALDRRRWENYRKLMREQALNAASLADRRARDRSLGRYYRSVLTESVQRKRGR